MTLVCTIATEGPCTYILLLHKKMFTLIIISLFFGGGDNELAALVPRNRQLDLTVIVLHNSQVINGVICIGRQQPMLLSHSRHSILVWQKKKTLLIFQTALAGIVMLC